MRGSCAQLRGASAASDCATGGGPVKPSWPAGPPVPRIVRHVSMDAFLGERIGGSGIDAGGATVAGLQRALSSGLLTSAELTAFYLARIKRLNPDLHAVITVSPEALAEARASDSARSGGQPPPPLEGTPPLLKHNT